MYAEAEHLLYASAKRFSPILANVHQEIFHIFAIIILRMNIDLDA